MNDALMPKIWYCVFIFFDSKCADMSDSFQIVMSIFKFVTSKRSLKICLGVLGCCFLMMHRVEEYEYEVGRAHIEINNNESIINQ